MIWIYVRWDGSPLPHHASGKWEQALDSVRPCSSKRITKNHASVGFLTARKEADPGTHLFTFTLNAETYLFAAEGRIDNRSELLSRLDVRQAQEGSDEELIRQAFLKWRENAPKYLLGDWSFIAFNLRQNKLFCAQDHHGVTALHYYSDPRICIVSSSIKPLLHYRPVGRRVDIDKILRTASALPADFSDGTYFENIHLLNAAHRMWIHPGRIKKERYWHPEHIAIDDRISPADAAETLRTLFDEAVRCRIGGGRIASELSGGLDSGCVVSFAARQLQEEGRPLYTFSHVPRYDFPPDVHGNERPFIDATIAHVGNIVPRFLDAGDMGVLDGIRVMTDALDEPIPAAINAFWMVDLLQHARQSGCDVLLFGKQGNGTISYKAQNSALPLAEFYARYGLYRSIRTKLLGPWYRSAKQLLASLDKRQWQSYCYLDAQYVEKTAMHRTFNQSVQNPGYTPPDMTNRERQMHILQIGAQHSLANNAKMGDYFGVRKRDPTGDKRIIEFLLSLPTGFFLGPDGEKKYLYKQAMRGRLPEKVIYQRAKGSQGADALERMRPELPEIRAIIEDFEFPQADRALFDKKRLLEDLEAIRQNSTVSTTSASHLLRTVGLMMFLEKYSH